QSVVTRVASLPLVSSACGALSSAYSSAKESAPYLRGMMDAAESGARTLGAAAASGSRPLLDRLEPQLTVVNEYACKGLDRLEEKLPILQQPTEKVVADTRELVSSVQQSVSQSVSGARQAVTGAVTGAVGVAKGAVQGSVDVTRAAVSGGVSTVMGSRVGQMLSSGVDLALSRSEEWVEQLLPLSRRELAALSEPVSGGEAGPPVAQQSYFVRLGTLSAKVRERALELSLGRARRAHESALSTLASLTTTLDLIERTKAALGSATDRLGGAQEQLLQRWAEWKEGQPGGKEAEEDKGQMQSDDHAELEGRALSMARGLSAQLRAACSGVVSTAQGLPVSVQEQVAAALRAAEELQASLGGATSFSDPLLAQSRARMAQVRQSVDATMEYLLNNTPLNWLVGPFSPQITEKSEEGEQGVPQSQGQ
ncbi:PLIN3 protein, partial [Atractosteus spatula]|nr:PLIN3 protein [Atractosteus spatula]